MFRLKHTAGIYLTPDNHQTSGEKSIKFASFPLAANETLPSRLTSQTLFRHENRFLYNAEKTLALGYDATNRTAYWTDPMKAARFHFVSQNPQQAPNEVWLVASDTQLVLDTKGQFNPPSSGSSLTFTKEDASIESVSSLSLSSTSAPPATTSVKPWGKWIYIFLVFFLALLIYFIYLLDKAACLFSVNG